MLLNSILQSNPGIATLSGGNSDNSDPSAPYDSYAGFRIIDDGTIFKRELNGTLTQLSAATDWLIPNGKAQMRTYHVRYNYSGDTLHAASDSVNSWILLSGVGSLEWYMNETVFGFFSGGGDILLSRDAGSTTLVSAAYSMSVNNF